MPNLVAPSGRNEFTVTLDLRNATLVAVLLGNVGAPNAYTCQLYDELSDIIADLIGWEALEEALSAGETDPMPRADRILDAAGLNEAD